MIDSSLSRLYLSLKNFLIASNFSAREESLVAVISGSFSTGFKSRNKLVEIVFFDILSSEEGKSF